MASVSARVLRYFDLFTGNKWDFSSWNKKTCYLEGAIFSGLSYFLTFFFFFHLLPFLLQFGCWFFLLLFICFLMSYCCCCFNTHVTESVLESNCHHQGFSFSFCSDSLPPLLMLFSALDVWLWNNHSGLWTVCILGKFSKRAKFILHMCSCTPTLASHFLYFLTSFLNWFTIRMN